MSLSQVSDGGVSGDFEHPNANLRRAVIVALYFAFILSTVSVVLRLVARRITGTGLLLDDYLIVAALLFKYGCSIGVVVLLFNGMGSHITTIPPENLEVYMKIGWSNPFVYTTCIALIKLSVLALYKRLFTTQRMCVAVNVVASFVILWTLSIYIVGLLQCLPVNKFWNREIEGTCIDPAMFFYGMQIPNILTDAVLLVMPLKPVWSLRVSTNQRILLSFVFLVGILTLIFDIIRLVAMIQFTHSGPDITYNQVPFVVWTCIEAAVGITAACLSNLRPLFRLGQRDFWSQARQSTGHSKEELNKSQDLSLEGSSIGYVQGGIYTRHSVSIQHEEA
ncbi:putative integral membrane protein Pth11-like [Aspergillus candidus]|uniref:Integral membrane protein n=1 Tax=Aspergillus candidus TaxID=41067 RepID=A0A2I2FGL8_ASPCN|nr:integral membrane protein [Aspergillus candidus]PLB39773.1 integral membrane protein [Aspergillus candidus]